MRAPTPSSTITVLLVDDDPDIAELTAAHLEREDDRFDVETATNADEGLARLAEAGVDCIVSDYDMPGLDGIALLKTVREGHPDLPFILYTGEGSEEVASEAISAGVTDYLQKETGASQYTVLANRVMNAVERSRTALERSQQRLSLFVEQSPLGVIEFDEEFTIVGVNPAGEEILGYDEADLVGHTWERIVTEESYDDVDRVTDELARGEGGWHSVNENVRADGERIVCEWHNRVVTDDNGDVVAVFSQCQDVTDRVERERELRQYEAYIEGSTDIITALDEEGVVQYQSPSVTRVLGYGPNELVGENGFDYIHPDDRQAVIEAFDRVVENPSESVTVNYRIRTAAGEWRWIETRGRNLLDDPDVGAVVANNRDVTDRAEQTRPLTETNALLSTLVERLPVGVLAEDAERNVLAANDRLFELFGIEGSPEDAVGLDSTRLNEALDGQFVSRADGLVADSGPVREDELVRRDGRTFARSHDPLSLPGGEGSLWVYRDVTENAVRERRLTALNETSRELMSADGREAVVAAGVEAAREVLGLDANAIHLADDDGNLEPVAVTDRLSELVGDPPTFTGNDSIAWNVYEHGTARAVDDVRDEPNVYREDTPVRGELYVPVGDHGILIAGSDTPEAFDQQDIVYGEILAGNVAAALDQVAQTNRLRERERELTRKNARLEEFASVVSHDLRNPLNVAQGRVSLASEECESADLDHATAALDRCQALIDDLLVLARGGNDIGEMESVSLPTFARQCWAGVSTDGAALAVTATRSVHADRSRLQQLFENLFRNAVEHGSTDSQGAQRPDDPDEHSDAGLQVTVGALEDGFYVADDGPGIGADVRDTVFESGHSTKPDGTGFGLNIVSQVAEAHGWTVEVTASETGGARFELRGVEFAD